MTKKIRKLHQWATREDVTMWLWPVQWVAEIGIFCWSMAELPWIIATAAFEALTSLFGGEPSE